MVPAVVTLWAAPSHRNYSEPASPFAMQLLAMWSREPQPAEAAAAYRAISHQDQPTMAGIRMRRTA